MSTDDRIRTERPKDFIEDVDKTQTREVDRADSGGRWVLRREKKSD